MMRDDFCALILTHGRPASVLTLTSLQSYGYTGKVYFVVDDEDKTLPEYRALYGDRVLTFSKAEIAARFDEADNFNDRRAIFYARNAAFDLARSVGCRYFIQLDDDYISWYYRFGGTGEYGVFRLDPLDWIFERLVEYLAATPFASIAISQGGDHIGGGLAKKTISAKRKAMNTFVCDTERRFAFVGRVNEDVNTYVAEQRRGVSFLTFMSAQVNQRATQTAAGGMTDLYRDSGTYVKSFYSVMLAPSCVRVSELGDPRVEGVGHRRLHHLIDWNAAAPLILEERHRKPDAKPKRARKAKASA